ncbi:hypothetical protein Tco_0565491 [Tanacetum coccineum]
MFHDQGSNKEDPWRQQQVIEGCRDKEKKGFHVLVFQTEVGFLDRQHESIKEFLHILEVHLIICGDMIQRKLGSFVSFREMITSQLQGKLWLYDEVLFRPPRLRTIHNPDNGASFQLCKVLSPYPHNLCNLVVTELDSTDKLVNEIGELRGISSHVLGEFEVQIPQNNLDNQRTIEEEDGATEVLDPRDVPGSVLLEIIDFTILGLLLEPLVLGVTTTQFSHYESEISGQVSLTYLATPESA